MPISLVPSLCDPVKVRGVMYDDIHDLRVLDGVQGIVILMRVRDTNVGHFVALFKSDTGLAYFDPYGMTIGQDLHISHNPNTLLDLLKGKRVRVNSQQYQKELPHINTCLFHCITRIRLHTLTDNEYRAFLRTIGDYDDAVVLLNMFNQPKRPSQFFQK